MHKGNKNWRHCSNIKYVFISNFSLYRLQKEIWKKEKRIRLRKRDEVFPFFGKENIFYKEISETLFLGNIAPFKNIRRDCAQSKYIRTYVSLHLFSQSIPDMKHFLARSLSLSLRENMASPNK